MLKSVKTKSRTRSMMKRYFTYTLNSINMSAMGLGTGLSSRCCSGLSHTGRVGTANGSERIWSGVGIASIGHVVNLKVSIAV